MYYKENKYILIFFLNEYKDIVILNNWSIQIVISVYAPVQRK